MGYMRHHAILVTTWDEAKANAAHDAAAALEMSVTPVMESAINGYYSFAVLPDGSKEGWSESEKGDEARAKFIEWTRAQAYEDGSNIFDWCEVQYGDDEDEAEILQSGDEDNKRRTATEDADV